MDTEHRKNWCLRILPADQRTLAHFWLLLLAYFAIFLNFFLIVLSNIAILSVEGG